MCVVSPFGEENGFGVRWSICSIICEAPHFSHVTIRWHWKKPRSQQNLLIHHESRVLHPIHIPNHFCISCIHLEHKKLLLSVFWIFFLICLKSVGIQRHRQQVSRIISWTKSPKEPLADEQNNSENLASTLDKLHAWEKKLCDESKVIDWILFLFLRKYFQVFEVR